MKKLLTILLIPFFLMALTSCDEETVLSGGPSDEDMQPVSDNMQIEKGVMNAVSYANPYGLDEDLSGKSVTNGPVMVWINPAEFIIEMDFTNVTNASGKIIVDYDSNPFAVGLDVINAVVTMEDFVNDGSPVYNGVLNFSMSDGLTTPVFELNNTGLEALTMTNGSKVASWLGEKTMTWLEGRTSPLDRLDDAYSVSGNSTGVSVMGDNYSVISTGLYLTPECEYIMDGTMVIVNNVGTDSQTTLTMDFGVDSNGNELTEPNCNSYFKLKYENGTLTLNMVMNMDTI